MSTGSVRRRRDPPFPRTGCANGSSLDSRFAADLAPGELVEDSSDLMDQVVADLYLYRHRDVAGEVSRILQNGWASWPPRLTAAQMRVSPAAEPDQLPSLVAERVWFANWVRRGLRPPPALPAAELR